MYKRHLTAERKCRRVDDFLTANPVEGTQVKLQELQQVTHGMAMNGEEMDASTRVLRGEVGRQRSLRNALWNRHMIPTARIARKTLGAAGLDQKFTLPPKRADNQALLAAARGMLQATEAHAAVFVQQAGLPAEFTQQFRSAIDDLAGVLNVRVEAQRRRKGSLEALQKLVKTGNAIIEVLDAIVSPRLDSKPDLLATWKSVKRPIELGGSPGLSAVPDITPAVKAA